MTNALTRLPDGLAELTRPDPAQLTPPDPARLTLPNPGDLSALLLIRHFETTLLELFAAGALNGTTHTCLGQEYIPVALQPLLRPEDHIFSNHRGHGHYLARFDDPAGLLAEIMGRAGAVCGGVGGSQHIYRDRYLSTGVQGESLPVAVGMALGLRRRSPGALALAYIGDGTWGEGAVYEALNMAALWRVPVVVVVENNGIAQSTPTHRQMAGTIAARAAAFGIPHQRLETADLAVIRQTLGPALDQVRESGTPLVVEFLTDRVGPHSKGDDSRTEAELAWIQANDWYPRLAALYPEEFASADDAQRQRVAAVVTEVRARPPHRSAW